ncbi:MAG: leucine-rich repeat domain-containing protein, partial [Promethearchaeota archaeon]
NKFERFLNITSPLSKTSLLSPSLTDKVIEILNEPLNILCDCPGPSFGSGENLRFIPDCIGDLRNLKILNLNYNEISEIPTSIGYLEKLEYFYLKKDEGKLSIIPENLINLKNLKVLDLTGNTVQNMPESIKSLESLKI